LLDLLATGDWTRVLRAAKLLTEQLSERVDKSGRKIG
jgi:hypothetical protein